MIESGEYENYCAYCNNSSKFNCSRCRIDFYCSEKCQIKDFPNHRYICFPMPDLIPIKQEATLTSSNDNEKLDDQKEIQLDDGYENQLEISEDKEAENDELEQQNGIIEDVSSGIRQDDTVIGTLSITSSFNDDTFDDGVADTIKQIQQSFNNDEILKNLRLTDEMEEFPIVNHVIPLKQSCLDLIATKSDKLFTIDNLKIHEWPKAKNIKVKLQTIIQQPNIIAFVEDKITIEHFYEYMESEIKKYRPCISEDYQKYLPKKNEIVLGQYNGSWYRAVVLDADPKGIIVLFIDYGNMELLSTDEVLSISNEYFISKLSFEICSRQFIVDNVPAVLDAKQKEILESKSMMITNIRTDDKGLDHCEIFGF